MGKKYKLIKDIPWIKAWAIFIEENNKCFISEYNWQARFAIWYTTWEWFEEIKEEKKTDFRIWDKIAVDLYYYDKDKKWRCIDFEIISILWLNDWEIVSINKFNIEAIRLATPEEIEEYFLS